MIPNEAKLDSYEVDEKNWFKNKTQWLSLFNAQKYVDAKLNRQAPTFIITSLRGNQKVSLAS